MNSERDDDLDRLLAGIGAAKADEGFEQRMVQGVAARVAVQPRASRRWAWGLGFATAVVAMVAVLVVGRAHHSGGSLVAKSPAAMPAKPSQEPLREEATAPQPVILVARKPSPSKRIGPAKPVPAATVDAEAETSFPAPPLPLSDQEHLLLKVVHQNDPVEIAMLIPEVRERIDAREQAAVDKFFYKPPTVDEKGNLLDANGKPFNAPSKGDQQ